MFSNIISTKRSNIKFDKAEPETIGGEIKKQLQPWQLFSFSPEKKQFMYLTWGRHCATTQEMELAEKYFDMALALRPDDAKSLYTRSICRRGLANTMHAYEDSLKATYLEPSKPNMNEEFCQSLYELNEFEAALSEAKDIARTYKGPYRQRFEQISQVIHENLKDSLGDSIGYFFRKNRSKCDEVVQEYKRENSIDARPLWKILKEQNNCDVISILEKKEELVHPLELARRNCALKNYYQRYLERSWVDVIMLQNVAQSNICLSQNFKESTPKLRELLTQKNKAIKNFAKMLHGRCPLYVGLESINKRKKLYEKYRESYLYLVQYQTRRNMFLILRTIRHLTSDIERLAKYVEKAMGDYIIVKARCVAPWKFEFMNDVYNSLALAYANMWFIPPEFDITNKNAYERLLRLPKPTDFTVNDKEFVCSNINERKEINYEIYLPFFKRMDKRLVFAKYSLEKAYIYHEIARIHFKVNHMNDCAVMAQKGLQEAIQSNASNLYAFLCALLAARAYACNFRIDKSLQDIIKAKQYADALKCPRLIEFINLAQELVETKIAEQKKYTVAVDKKHRGKHTLSLESGSKTSSLNTNLDQPTSFN